MDQALVSQFDAVGTIMVQGETGEAPNAPRILALLKPEACKLGGELVLVNASANLTTGLASSSTHSFLVFRRKATGAPASQKF